MEVVNGGGEGVLDHLVHITEAIEQQNRSQVIICVINLQSIVQSDVCSTPKANQRVGFKQTGDHVLFMKVEEEEVDTIRVVGVVEWLLISLLEVILSVQLTRQVEQNESTRLSILLAQSLEYF